MRMVCAISPAKIFKNRASAWRRPHGKTLEDTDRANGASHQAADIAVRVLGVGVGVGGLGPVEEGLVLGDIGDDLGLAGLKDMPGTPAHGYRPRRCSSGSSRSSTMLNCPAAGSSSVRAAFQSRVHVPAGRAR